jgi:hypothetical protein
MPQNLSAQFVCPSPKVLDFNEKRLHWTLKPKVWLYIGVVLSSSKQFYTETDFGILKFALLNFLTCTGLVQKQLGEKLA